MKTVNISRISEPQKVSVSKNTHHYLELYTNNYWFQKSNIEIKGVPEQIFYVSNLRGRMKAQDRNVIKSYEGHLNTGDNRGLGHETGSQGEEKDTKGGVKPDMNKNAVNLNESESIESGN